MSRPDHATSGGHAQGSAAGPTNLRGPSFRSLLFGSGPRFMRDAFGATVVFYVGWKLVGLFTGVVAATVWTLAVYAWERRRERPGIAARIGLGIALVQAMGALLTESPIGYFAPPVLINGVYGLGFLVSVAIGRPLAGVLAMESYPIPPEVRRLPAFRRAFTHISLAWGVYLVLRSVLRLALLMYVSVDVYVLVNILTAGPMIAGMMAWSFWYGLRSIRRAVTASAEPKQP